MSRLARYAVPLLFAALCLGVSALSILVSVVAAFYLLMT